MMNAASYRLMPQRVSFDYRFVPLTNIDEIPDIISTRMR